MLLNEELFEEDVKYIMSLIRLEFQTVLEEQGHGKKGFSKLIDSMEYAVEYVSTLIVGRMYAEDYGIFVDRGVKAANIPFGGAGKGKKVSQYIQGLFRFWRKKGLNAANALRASFATANKHKKEGMSTKASYRFSKIGTRHRFVDIGIKRLEANIIKHIETRFGDKIDTQLVNIIEKWQRN